MYKFKFTSKLFELHVLTNFIRSYHYILMIKFSAFKSFWLFLTNFSRFFNFLIRVRLETVRGKKTKTLLKSLIFKEQLD